MNKHNEDYSKRQGDIFLEVEDRKRLQERAELLEQVVRVSGGTQSIEYVAQYRDTLCELAKSCGIETDTECQVMADEELRQMIAQEPELFSRPFIPLRPVPVWHDPNRPRRQRKKAKNEGPSLALRTHVRTLREAYRPDNREDTRIALLKVAKLSGSETDAECEAFVDFALRRFEEDYAERDPGRPGE